MNKKAKGNKEILIILGVVALLIFLYGGTHGWFQFNFSNHISQPLTPYPSNVVNYPSYFVILGLVPSTICAGGSTIGTISSNINNGICSIFFQTPTTTWQLYANVNLNAQGDYSVTNTINTSGRADFVAVCCDGQNNCKLSNQVTLIVNPCGGDSDGDGVPDSIDPDDDNDGWSDDDEIGAGTDPLDPNSHPTASNCNTQCISKGYISGRGPFESGGSCSYPEVIEYLIGESGLICCCMPSQSYTCGQGNDAQCGGTCPSTYPYCLQVYTGLYTYSCMCADSNSATGNIHPDWKPGASMFNEFTEPECYSNSDCGTNNFCYQGECKPRCQDPGGVIRTNYLGAWYDACWNGCGYDRDCCARTYFYYDGAIVNDERWYYYACKWVEGQRCSSFDPCIPPGGNHP